MVVGGSDFYASGLRLLYIVMYIGNEIERRYALSFELPINFEIKRGKACAALEESHGILRIHR